MNKSYFIIIFCALSSLAYSMPLVDEQYNYYPINGTTSKELRQKLSAQGPIINGEHFDAQVNWYINWNYYWNNQPPGQCQITSVKIKIKIRRAMPKWENEEKANSNLQVKWDKYLKNLSFHEQGHANNGLLAAQEIEQALLNTPAMPNCKQLKKLLDDTAYSIIEKHNQWDSYYDAQTQHGRAQGASFP